MLDSIKPGDTITCTVTRDLRPGDKLDTVRRLMRLDPDIKRKLKKAQEYRMKTLLVRSRGKRPWAVRRKASKAANPAAGVTWSMTYIPHVRKDFLSVQDCVTVKKA